jgi:metallo-beta-lactamase family protein
MLQFRSRPVVFRRIEIEQQERERIMKLHFLGANRQVTGSRYCLEVNGLKIMVDCGMFQERPLLSRNWEPCPIPVSEIDALVLTHVHIDHSGMIPRLVQEGFRGPIYCTRPSVELAEIILRDSAKIQSEDVRYKRRRHEKEGRRVKHPVVPLYTEEAVSQTIPLMQGVPYGKPIQLGESLSATFHEAGHILGSAMIEFHAATANGKSTILFSGDIGQWDKPIIRDPTLFEHADYVVMESTYGDRDHPDSGDIQSQLERAINDTAARGGNVVIPTFAIERAQEVIYYIGRLAHARRIPQLDVFLDSPMAIDVMEVFRHYRECFDKETWEQIVAKEPPLQFPGLKMARSTKESKAINEHAKPCVIMSTSGMCTAGRIKHHLRKNIGRQASTILFVGYQAHGTLGRQILMGDPIVRIHGRQWKVKADIQRIDGFSGHADHGALLQWVGNLKNAPKHIFLTHGEQQASDRLAETVRTQFGWSVSIPEYLESVDLEPL